MKIKVLFFTLLALLLSNVGKAQVPTHEDSLKGFSMKEMEHHLESFKGTLKERNERIEKAKRAYIVSKYNLYAPPQNVIDQRNGISPPVQALSCTNIGFDNGNTTGWTVAGANAITSGAGLDPFGNFPVVFSGTNSLQLNNDLVSNSTYTTTVSRVLSVPATGTNLFKLSFAIDILDYPHTQNASAKFFVKFFDQAGNLVPCPQFECYYYQNSANVGVAVGVSNFQQSACPGNCGSNIGGQTFSVTYAPWQTIAMDLTPYNGTNVTAQIICQWCIYQYDFAYAYIDAECPTSATSNVPTCGTLPFTLSGPTGMDSYSWVAPPGNNPATATTPTINASVSGTFTLNSTITTCSTEAYTFTYSVESGPTPSFTDALLGTCSGNASFVSTSTPNGGPPISGYTWEWGDGTGNGTTATSTHNFATSGTKTVTLVITNGSCVDSITGTLVVPPHPTASFTNANNCVNAISNFTSTSTSSVAINSENWTYGDGGTGSGTPVSHTYASAGNYSVTLVIVDANSCVDSVTQAITINPLPTITVNSPSICGGVQTATLTAGGASTYTWSPGLSSTTGTSVTGTPTVTTDYTITGTNANGCVNTATTSISLNPNPTITATSSTICIGQQTGTLTATGGVTYTWTPATLTPTTGSVVTGTPAVTTQYTVTGSNAGGCVGTATATISINTLPIITVNSSTICEGQQTATLTAAGAVTYSWNPSATLSSNTGNPVTGTPTVTTVYTITGTDINGCVNTGNSTITVLPASPVTVNSPTICVGQQTATLTANGATTYSWNPSATLSSNAGTTVTGTPVVTTSYTVTAVNPSGCVSTATSTITVNPLPIMAVNSASICIGQQTANLTAMGAVNYAWNPVTGLAPTTGSIVTGTPIVTTDYTVTGTDANGCVSTATSTITVYPLPLPTATSNTPCANQQALVLDCPLNNMATYFWYGPNTYTSVVQNPTIPIANVTAAAVGTYTVLVTDNNNCTNFATVNVIVNPLPVVTVNSVTVCENQAINLTSSGGVSYSWSGPNAYTSASQNPSIPSAALNMFGSYVVTVTDGNGCVNANVASVIVNSLPVLSVNSATICLGQQTATLTAVGASTYTWTPSNTLSGSFGSMVNASPNVTTNYIISATDNNGCESDTNATVLVVPIPIITTSSVTPTCIPLCTTFTATSTTPINNYSWTFGSGNTASGTLGQPSTTFTTITCYTVAGTYVVNLTATDINNCINTSTTIAVAYPIPVANFAFQPQPVTINAPQVQFFNQSSGAIFNPSNAYNWNFGDIYSTSANDTSSLTNPSHLYSDTGTYIVTLSVTSNYGCTATVSEPLVVLQNYDIYVPNAFTPNGDGKNEIFKAVGEGIIGFKMYIFDRWGNNLFYSDDINQGWNGTYLARGTQIVQEDVYVWKIDLTDFANKNHSLHGTVTLVK
jgi:gliding motility-associated-like protein